MRFSDRDLRIVEMRKAGETYRKIGETFDISAQRVRQICERWRRNTVVEKWKREREIADADTMIGLTASTWYRLRDAGIDSLESLREAAKNPTLLESVPGIGKRGVREIYLYLNMQDPTGLTQRNIRRAIELLKQSHYTVLDASGNEV